MNAEDELKEAKELLRTIRGAIMHGQYDYLSGQGHAEITKFLDRPKATRRITTFGNVYHCLENGDGYLIVTKVETIARGVNSKIIGKQVTIQDGKIWFDGDTTSPIVTDERI